MSMSDQSFQITDGTSPEDHEEQGLRILAKVIARELSKRRKDDQIKVPGQKPRDLRRPD